MIRAIYAGSFDPITLGHLDVIERGAKVFDHLIVAMAVNVEKTPLFTLAERRAFIAEATKHLKNVQVDSFDTMAVDYARAKKAKVLLRGIRTLSDFEAEFQMALTNRAFAPDIETVFVMSSLEYSFVSSRLIKEAATLGGDVSKFVPPAVAGRLKEKFARG
ncbi:MAG: pantetheine-phosphate adenylyltransferase [Planctomycetes bacterium]|nr:pantetheine-phosphate adenylyltransferase [Planctomycetota bacterium]